MSDHSHHPGSPAAFESKVKTASPHFDRNLKAMAEMVTNVRNEEQFIAHGGGDKAIESQHKKGRLTARERIACSSIRYRRLRTWLFRRLGHVRRMGRRSLGRRGAPDWRECKDGWSC